MTAVPTIDVETLAATLKDKGKGLFLLDVREAWESDLAAIPGAHRVSLGELPAHLAEIPRDRPVAVHCHHGGRSARAVAYLLSQGYGDVVNVAGGIHAWSEKIDPGVKTY